MISVLGSWLRDHPQDFWDPPAHQNLGNVLIFLGWAAPGGAEAREAEKLLEEFLEEAKGEQAKAKEEQRLAWAGKGHLVLVILRLCYPSQNDRPRTHLKKNDKNNFIVGGHHIRNFIKVLQH